MSEAETVTVSILDKEYQVSCQPDEVSALKQSASLLDQKMREMKSKRQCAWSGPSCRNRCP